MNRRKYWLLVLLIGCGGGVATMNVTVPARTLFSSSNGSATVTVSGQEGSWPVANGVYDPETGKYSYTVEAFTLEDIPSGTYTGTVALALPGAGGPFAGFSEVIGSCTLDVNAENQTQSVTWHDQAIGSGPQL
jgi:hypothetical protein